MVTREEILGNWNQVKGRLQEHWAQLSDDDLSRFRGQADQLIGLIQQKTGETRSSIERFLSDVVSDGNSLGRRVGDATSHYAADASDYLRDGYDRAGEFGEDFAKRVSHSVRTRPTESLLIAFGVGIVAGAVFFMGRRR